jgi:hypothetical protein
VGGIGSGRRWHHSANNTINNHYTIDVRRWRRDGLLKPGHSFNWCWSRNGEVVASIQVRVETNRVILIYRHQSRGGEWKDKNYSVRLDWTLCNLGGQRPWFRCPVWSCGRRVAILYSGPIFTCRHCYSLAYPSQRETWDERVARRTDRIRSKLGWKPGFLNGRGPKPKWMHWRTFEQLTAEHDVLVNLTCFP